MSASHVCLACLACLAGSQIVHPLNREDQKKLKAEVHQQKCRNIKLEAYTRRENIKIFNLPEIRGETPSHTEELVRSMFEEKMNISKEDVDDITGRPHKLCDRLYFEFIEALYGNIENSRIIVLDCDRYSHLTSK